MADAAMTLFANHFESWAHAVELQWKRVHNAALAQGKPIVVSKADLQADGHLFVIAAELMVAGAEVLASLLPKSKEKSISDAVSKFRQDIPSSRLVRNTLEHFDDYLRGCGATQKARQLS